MKSTILRPAIIAFAALGLAGCSSYYDDGYGYGYNRVAVSYGNYHRPYYGWYDNYYYPGTGYYVYDRYRTPYRGTDAQRRYWTLRRERALRLATEKGIVYRDNWEAFDLTRSIVRTNRAERGISKPARVEQTSRSTSVERGVNRVERSTAKAQRRSEARSEQSSRSNGRRLGITHKE